MKKGFLIFISIDSLNIKWLTTFPNTSRSLSTIVCCISCFELSPLCLEMCSNMEFCVWYVTHLSVKSNSSCLFSQEMIGLVKDCVVLILHTHDGARVGMHCLWHGTTKVSFFWYYWCLFKLALIRQSLVPGCKRRHSTAHRSSVF